MVTFSPAIHGTCSLPEKSSDLCSCMCFHLVFHSASKPWKRKQCLTVQQPPGSDESSLTAHQVVSFVQCTYKPKLLIPSPYQAGAYASCLRDLVLSSHLFPALPSPAQHTSLKLLPVSSGEHLKEDRANVDIILCSKCVWRCMSCWALL